MYTQDKQFHNTDYQAQVAASLLKECSKEEAIRFCLEHRWNGVLHILTKQEKQIHH